MFWNFTSFVVSPPSFLRPSILAPEKERKRRKREKKKGRRREGGEERKTEFNKTSIKKNINQKNKTSNIKNIKQIHDCNTSLITTIDTKYIMSNSDNNKLNTSNITNNTTTQIQRSHNEQQKQEEYKPTLFQLSLGILIIGASAGLTLYTKKTKAMLEQMKRVEENRLKRMPKKKQFYGPLTREEWERVRNRWNDNDDVI